MPVPTLVTDLSTTLASNSPAGSENVFPSLDDYLRSLAGFIASIRDNSGNGWVSPYLPLAGGTVTGATIFSSTVALNGALSGTGLTTYLASPPAIGGTTPAAGSFTTLSASGNVTLSGGTANGVLYLNGSKVATSGSALTFDGTNAATTGTSSATKFIPTGGTATGNGMYLSAANTLGWSTNGTKQLELDSSGNLGLGVTPSAWGNLNKALQLSGAGAVSSTVAGNTASRLSHGAYFDNTNWRYTDTSIGAARYEMTGANGGSTHAWYVSAGGTAGNTISFTQALTLDANCNLLLNGTTAGASSVGTFTIFNGTAPTGSVTDGVILFAQDIASSSELRVRDEAGNVTTLSPHNFSLIPEGPSEEMAWAYYSEKGGKRINVDMLKLARMVEKLTGEKLVYEV